MTTGNVSTVDQPGAFADTNDGGPAVRGDTDFDVSILKIDLVIPANNNCLSFNFRFFSEEYPRYVNTDFNDAFIAELDTSDWTTAGSTITAPHNFAFDASGDVVSINSTGLGGMSPANGAGTAFDGATTGPTANTDGAGTVLLNATTPITPGAHSLYLSLFDQGDLRLDSAVFLDSLQSAIVTSPAEQCRAGATEATHLTLIKAVDNTGGGTAAATDWTLTATGPTTISGHTGDAPITNASIAAGTYTLSETGPSGYSASAWACTGGTLTGDSLALAAGATATCTITNTFAAPPPAGAQLTLVKTVDNTAGGTAVPTDWTLTATGPTPIAGHSGDASITNAAVTPGRYRLSESGGPGSYTASSWSCTGGTLVGSRVTLASGESATCTINNTYVVPSQAAYVSILIDRSGSMNDHRARTISRFDAWLSDEQNSLPDAHATLALFNSCGYVQRGPTGRIIARAPALTMANYHGRCNTPLYDAIAKTINRAARNPLSNAGGVVIVVYTDGQDNASQRWTRNELDHLIADKTAAGWTFVWLGNSVDPLIQKWIAAAAT